MWLKKANLITSIEAATTIIIAVIIIAVSTAPVKRITVIYKYIKSLEDLYKFEYILLYLITSI